jgi:hypothetical protein
MKNDVVWDRIQQYAGAAFETSTRLRFHPTIDGNGIWIIRDGRVINRLLTRDQINRAIERCPLQGTMRFQDLQGPSYVFGILMDSRIRRGLW